MTRDERFEHPLIERYAGREMAQLFSPRSRHGAWRDLWIALAEAQMELGLPVTAEQVKELKAARDEFEPDPDVSDPTNLASGYRAEVASRNVTTGTL